MSLLSTKIYTGGININFAVDAVSYININILYLRANKLLQQHLDRSYSLIMKAFEQPDNALTTGTRDVVIHFPWG